MENNLQVRDSGRERKVCRPLSRDESRIQSTSKEADQRSMDTFTRNYSIVLGVILVILAGWWLSSSWQPEVWKLNEQLEEDAKLSDYPYQFRVKHLEDGVATLSSPRNAQVPAMRFLEILHPELASLAQDDPKVVAAQQDLIDHQKRAQDMVLSQPDVERVNWELDVQWLANHGVQVNGG